MASTRKNKVFKEGDIVSSEDIFKNQSFLAFVIDGEVVQTFICDKRMSAILQSNPTIVEVSTGNPFLDGPHVGWKYDGNAFEHTCIDESHNH